MFVDHATTVAPVDQTGELCTPFDSIQDALTFIGAPVDATDQARQFVVLCAPGVYTESGTANLITVPARRRILVRAWGGPSDVGSSWTTESVAPVLVLGAAETLSILWTSPSGVGSAATPPTFGFMGRVLGAIQVEDGGDAAAFNRLLVYEDVGPASSSSIDATLHVDGQLEIYFEAARCRGVVNAPPPTIIQQARFTRFEQNVVCFTIADARDCRFAGIDSGSVNGPGNAFLRNCTLDGDVQDVGPYSNVILHLDGATEYMAELNNIVFSGATEYDRIDDPLSTSVVVTFAMTPFTVDPPVRFISVNTSGGTVTVMAPPAADVKDDEEFWVNVDSGAPVNNVTVDGNGNSINGLGTVTMATAFETLHFKFIGGLVGEWRIV